MAGDSRLRALMSETNPWTADDDLRAALLYRGALVSAWATIESRIKELAIRCSRVEAYRSITPARFPRRPLLPYAETGLNFLDRFDATAEMRHIMAHSRMRVLSVDAHRF